MLNYIKKRGIITGGPYQGQKYILPAKEFRWSSEGRSFPRWQTAWLGDYINFGDFEGFVGGFVERDIPEKYLEHK